MAVKKTQMYRRQLDGTETDLNPLTESQYVLMDNGQTVQEILSDRDSDKYTPVITNSSSTFKVGQGDNVDLSSSMKEGAYDSCMLKGKTMANCIQEPSSKDVVLPYEFADGRYVTINDTKESGALGVELKGQTLVNLVPKMNNSGNESSLVYITEDEIKISEDSTAHRQMYWTSNEVLSKFKTNTTYTVIANITENTLASAFMLINAYAAVGGDIASDALCVPVNFTGRFVGVFRTVSDFTNRTRLGFNAGAGSEGKLTMKNDMVILEGDWTNQELPFDSFFTGMASCKMPILSTVGKNLFDGGIKNGSNLHINTGIEESGTRTIPLNFTKVKPNTTYTFSRPLALGAIGLRFYDKDKNYIKHGSTSATTSITFTTPNQCYYIKWVDEANKTTEGYQIEEGSTGTTYEPHKTSILSLPEEVVLRSLPNGVCDTFNTRTGVYTQMVQEFVFDGSDDEGWVLTNSSTSHETMIAFEVKDRDYMNNLNKHNNQPLLNNLFRVYTDKSWNYFDDEHFRQWGNGSSISWVCVIPRSKLSSVTVEGFKSWLSKNPMKVVAKLKTPIVTKINLPSTLKSWNTTTHIYFEIPENTLYPTLSHVNPSYPAILKPSTKYSIVANSYSNSHANSAINFNLGGATASTTVGNRVTTITTPSTLSNELLTMSGCGNKLNNVMVIEGDVVGDEPYFEGICDCKSPILLNIGKNLFDEQRHSNPDNFFVHSAYWSIPIQLKGNTEYKFSYTFNNVFDKQVVMRFATCPWTATAHSTYPYSLGQVFNKNITSNLMGRTESMLFTTPADGLVYLHYYNSELTNSPSSFNLASWYTHILKDIQLEESSTSTQYEPYQSNTTTFDQKDGKTIVLRSLPNGVCDTLNVETGEYVQRIGEVVLNGSENWGNAPSYINGNPRFCYDCSNLKVRNNVGNQLVLTNSDTIISVPSDVPKSATKGVFHHNTVAQIHIFIPSSEIGGTTPSNFKTYLQQNPVTVQYELETPIVSTIDVQGFPYAYANGHVQLSSGSIEQSLTPKVEYSLSANKTGQIDSNTRQVIRQQKQLDDFEAMMLTSLVQSAYDKAILQFDYEMQMMSLGGE